MRQVVLQVRPQGNPQATDFTVQDVPVPQAESGGLLVRTIWLSLDPYMQFGLAEKPMGAVPRVEIGSPMAGGAVSEVIASNAEGFAVGDILEGRTGWREYAAIGAAQLPGMRKITKGSVPLSTALGVLGMPGKTAYAGMIDIGRVRAGETGIISAASGAVGSLAGQIGKVLGARVVGIAGGAAKCAAVEALGFDACVDYKASDFAERLAAAVPEGADLYFENVGGEVTRKVLPLLKVGARMPMCGFISLYQYGDEAPGPDHLPGFMRMMMVKALEIRAFSGAAAAGPDALDKLSIWLADGRIKLAETVIEGIESAPSAFAGIFRGNDNVGKLVIRVGPEP